MKVLLINGSPRMKGNTNRALEEAASALEAEGVQTEIFWIGNKEIRGCIACGICKRTDDHKCVFAEDCCNELIGKIAEADGVIIGGPVYYAGVAGSVRSLLDRVFYAGGSLFAHKPAAGVGVARRAGAIEAADQINKYFQISNMPVVSSAYWGIAYGQTPGQAQGDAEGLHTMRTLARNMAWMIKCLDAGRAAGINPPAAEPKPFTNFVREDLLEG
ncbi:flavodoxin family protein [Adlercreutzia shanghongiae]|uniref:Flavodoxin family protein n=1 Tax=Adlercreutzia shanghongiae TaxID=3111773 RepID=A0ABU6IWQ9_9ACTN|nr:flavodoxin family protein [Adlercreutzia sp. R22]MEC4294254.1 flavodoxin family protein [Adlercreutzia sp. R22]